VVGATASIILPAPMTTSPMRLRVSWCGRAASLPTTHPSPGWATVMSTSVIVVSVSSCVMWRVVDNDVHKTHALCAGEGLVSAAVGREPKLEEERRELAADESWIR